MRTTFLLHQHKKCEELLEAIVTIDLRIKGCKESIAFHKSIGNDDSVSWYYKRWETNLAIKERLANSYSRVLTAIVKPTVDKILA